MIDAVKYTSYYKNGKNFSKVLFLSFRVIYIMSAFEADIYLFKFPNIEIWCLKMILWGNLTHSTSDLTKLLRLTKISNFAD